MTVPIRANREQRPYGALRILRHLPRASRSGSPLRPDSAVNGQGVDGAPPGGGKWDLRGLMLWVALAMLTAETLALVALGLSRLQAAATLGSYEAERQWWARMRASYIHERQLLQESEADPRQMKALLNQANELLAHKDNIAVKRLLEEEQTIKKRAAEEAEEAQRIQQDLSLQFLARLSGGAPDPLQ